MRRDVFQAIADPIRREILDLLKENKYSVGRIAGHFEISRQAVSKQLKILDECGMVEVTQVGRERFYSLRADELIPAFLWVESYKDQWEARIDSFETYLMKLKKKKNDKR